MNCPACGSLLKSRKSPKGQEFLTCSRWPHCKVSGTPELMERVRPPERTEIPIRIGNFIVQYAQLRIHQAKLKRAKTKQERDAVRQAAREALK